MLLLLVIAIAPATYATTLPKLEVIEQIENQLSSNDCVKPLSGWWRHYAFSKEGSIDTPYIDVWFVEAGHLNLRPGIFFTKPAPPMLDDSQFKLVSGKYEIATNRFVRLYCGFNHPGKSANLNDR